MACTCGDWDYLSGPVQALVFARQISSAWGEPHHERRTAHAPAFNPHSTLAQTGEYYTWGRQKDARFRYAVCGEAIMVNRATSFSSRRSRQKLRLLPYGIHTFQRSLASLKPSIRSMRQSRPRAMVLGPGGAAIHESQANVPFLCGFF
jgi:hypothetical protein